LYPEWNWGFQINTSLGAGKLGSYDYTILRAVVGLGQNDNVTWTCHQDGTWHYNHTSGLTFDQAAASILSFAASGIFGLVGDALKPFAEALGLGGAEDQAVGFIQSSIAKSEAQYQASADT
jgi:hypothetical protein